MKIGIIGQGAIARHVQPRLISSGHDLCAVLMRANHVTTESPAHFFGSVDALPASLDLIIDCAGHEALAAYGPEILRGGTDLVTVSLGALADQKVLDALTDAAVAGGTKLHLVSGAIGALDCLQAAGTGQLQDIRYIGRKPPKSWKGSIAEDVLALDTLAVGAHKHFSGNAREAALKYPKNANVAAAVALAGVGFDETHVDLIADADIIENIHEVQAVGDFGSFNFQISGKSLPDNPKSSALAAMSVVSKLNQLSGPIVI